MATKVTVADSCGWDDAEGNRIRYVVCHSELAINTLVLVPHHFKLAQQVRLYCKYKLRCIESNVLMHAYR